jgi:hypothetical protein
MIPGFRFKYNPANPVLELVVLNVEISPFSGAQAQPKIE